MYLLSCAGQVHERSLDSDFLLLILKEVLAKNKKIKVVLVGLVFGRVEVMHFWQEGDS